MPRKVPEHVYIYPHVVTHEAMTSTSWDCGNLCIR